MYFKIEPVSNYSFRFILSRVLPHVNQRKVSISRDPMVSCLLWPLFSRLLFGESSVNPNGPVKSIVNTIISVKSIVQYYHYNKTYYLIS